MPLAWLTHPAFSFAAVLGLTLICGLIGLPWLRRLQLRQTVRDDGPKTHLVKTGTPTFGGLFFLIPITLVAVIQAWRQQSSGELILLVITTLAFAAVGFLDDLIKVKINKKGLSVAQKSLLMVLISFGFAVYYLYLASEPAFFRMPISGSQWLISGWLRPFYLFFIVLYLFFISNSVNLTDGVDGLAGSVTTINALALAVISSRLVSQLNAAEPGLQFSLMIAAGCLGFLFFNWHPARVFMGDTGSQALGAALALIALLLGMPWLLLFTGLIYIIESLSVMIQVAYFKRTGGKRIFRMSPIHHHFELGGWPETKIVFVFSLVSLLACLAGWLLV